MIYYVYVYLREDGSPYYVGKGSNGRWWSPHRCTLRPLSKDKVIFPITQTTEEWAHFIEMKLIDDWGRLNDGTGILENLTDGGEGTSGLPSWNKGKTGLQKHTEEWKKDQSERMKGRKCSDETRRKIGEKNRNHNLGKRVSEETKKRISESNRGNIHSKETKRLMSFQKQGSKNNRSVIIEEDVFIIRTRKMNGERQCDVYRDYLNKIGRVGFNGVWNNKRWKHVIV